MSMSIGRLLMIIGLPGAGKTTLINKLEKNAPGPCVHDFHGHAIDNSSEVRKSRHYLGIVEALKAGNDCVIADIEFCRQYRRDIVVETLQAEVPGLAVEYHCFRNQPERCLRNVSIRNSRNVDEERKKIAELTQEYTIPAGAIEYDGYP